jgi:hypothetical protein
MQTDTLLRGFVAGLVVYCLFLIILAPFLMSFQSVESLSRIFENTAIGFGAIIAGIGGFKFILDSLANIASEKKAQEFKRLYPANKAGIDFEVVDSPIQPGKKYVIDKIRKVRRHIGSSQTYTDIGLRVVALKPYTENEFNKYPEGDIILTRGKPGT